MSNTAPDIRGPDSFSTLPEVLSELIRRVVRKARLWPSERRELIAELESHFREGLIELFQEVVSLEESIGVLRDGFGDPDLAARLIHRSKKRGRPMVWKILSTMVVLFVLFAAAGGGYLAYISYGAPTPTVDYMAKINEPSQKVPEGDRAWPVLREALLQFRPMPPELVTTQKNLPRPGDPNWSSAMAWVESNRSILPLLTEAASKPSYGFAYDNAQILAFMRLQAQARGEKPEPATEQDPLVPPTLAMLLPHLQDLRSLGRFLVLDAREHLGRGEFAEAWGSLDIAHRFGAMLYTGQTIIEQLIGVALVTLSTNEMRGVLYRTGDAVTADHLALVKASHVETMPICAIKGNFRAESFFFNDVVQYVFTDDGVGNGHLIPSQFAKLIVMGEPANVEPMGWYGTDAGMLAVAAVHADRRDTVARYHELWDKMEELYTLPLYDSRRAEMSNVMQAVRNDDASGQRYALVNFMLPDLSRANLLVREATMNELATRTLVAILQYRLEHGALPQRLGELTPRYVAAIPIDEFSGMHLRYSTGGGDFKLYSVGENLQDDGGSSKKIKGGEKGGGGPADIVYWPPTE